MSVCEAALGREAWERLPESIRCLHRGARVSGEGQVSGAETVFLRILARLLGLPRPARAARISLRVAGTSRGEIWRRRFDGRALVTRVALRQGVFSERCRGVELRFELRSDSAGLRYVQRGAALALGPFRLPLPAAIAPRVDAHDEAGREPFSVDFTVDLRLWGRRLVGYAGTVFPEDPR
jgi:hypothetical protein